MSYELSGHMLYRRERFADGVYGYGYERLSFLSTGKVGRMAVTLDRYYKWIIGLKI